MNTTTSYYLAELPWTPIAKDEWRFRKILFLLSLLLLVLSLVVPRLPVKELPKDHVVEVPPRLAKIIEERKQPPKPPAPKTEKIESKKVEDKPKKKPKPKKEEPKKKPDARKKAESSGLLAFKDELADLRDSTSLAKLDTNKLEKGIGKERKTERSMVTSNVGTGSGGVNTASLSRDTGGSGLAGKGSTQVTGPAGLSGAESGGSKKGKGKGRSSGRDLEKIQITFDKNKGAIYSIYNRALRKNPGLQGKVVLNITIDPSGKVTTCEVVSSELEDPKLERKLVQRVKLINFGAENAPEYNFTYPIDFFPA